MFERWPLRVADFAMRRPWRAIAFVLLATLALAPGLLRLELRTDGHALVPPDDPVVEKDAEIRAHFGLRDPIVVLIHTQRRDIYNLETLKRVQRLTAALAAIRGVGPDHVISLATEKRDKVYTGTLNFRPLLDPLPETPELMAELQDDVAAASLLTGTLVSYDGKATAVHVGTPAGAGRTVDRIAFYLHVKKIADHYAGGEDTIDVVGAPVAEALLGIHILEDLALLLPLSLGLVALVLWIASRRVWGVLLPLGNAGACLLATFGLMGWVGAPFHLPTAMLPVILTTIAVADEIHLFWQYQRILAAPGGAEAHPAGVRRTIERLARPIVFTCLSTAFGFLSFLSSPIAPVRSFGLFAGMGVLFCLGWSFLVTPAALTLLGPRRLVRSRRAEESPPTMPRWAHLPLRRPGLTLAALALITLVLGLGVGRLFVQDSWIDGFARGSDFYQATQRANRSLHGTHVLLAHLELPAPEPPTDEEALWEWQLEPHEPLNSPEVLQAVGAFEDHARSLPGVGGVLGPHSHLATVTYLWLGRRAGPREVPTVARRVATAWERFDMARGELRRREVVDDAKTRAVVTILLKNANYRDTKVLMDDLRGYVAEHLAPLGARLDFAGDVAVSQAMIPAIVRTQVSSTLLALVSSLVAVWAVTRSLRTALLTIVPVSMAVLWVFGVMGWTGTPLGVATSMFCAIALGIGVDYAIHFLERVRGREATVALALDEVGPAIGADALAIALGFGLLVISQVPANARFGGLVAFTLVASCLLTLGGLGALLSWVERRRGRGASS